MTNSPNGSGSCHSIARWKIGSRDIVILHLIQQQKSEKGGEILTTLSYSFFSFFLSLSHSLFLSCSLSLLLSFSLPLSLSLSLYLSLFFSLSLSSLSLSIYQSLSFPSFSLTLSLSLSPFLSKYPSLLFIIYLRVSAFWGRAHMGVALNGFVMAGRRCEASIEHRLKQMKEDGRR
jgi:hypothetical protein